MSHLCNHCNTYTEQDFLNMGYRCRNQKCYLRNVFYSIDSLIKKDLRAAKREEIKQEMLSLINPNNVKELIIKYKETVKKYKKKWGY